MFAYLVVHRHRDVGLDELAANMWPRGRPNSWNSAVRAMISKVRQTLHAASIPGEALRSRRGYVELRLPDAVTVDLEDIRARMRAESSGSGAESAEVRARWARHVHTALNAQLLRGVEGQWADDIRLEFASFRLQALLIDASASSELGEYDRSVVVAEATISADPLNEAAYRHAVRGYLAIGDRAGALGAASRCRRALTDELGVDPSAESESLFSETLEQPSPPSGARLPRHDSGLPPRSGGTFGRERELAVISRAWEAAGRGAGQCIVVTGDAGTGKTALVLEALSHAEQHGLDVLYGRCSEDAIVAFEPFADAVARELDACSAAGARQWLRENGSDILRLVPSSVARFPDLIVPPPPGDDRAGVVAAVHRWLSAPTRTKPTLLVVDDVQWASSTTHALVRYLIQANISSTICLILTVRTNQIHQPEVNATLNTATRLGNVHRIALRELEIDAVRQLVTDRRSSLDPEALYGRTHGHPLFVTSLLDDDGALGCGPLPESIVEFVERIEYSLSEPARSVLRLCALIGGVVPRRLLHIASVGIDDVEFADALDELERSHMLESSRGGAERSLRQPSAELVPDDELTIRHPLVQEIVYAGISAGGRAELHSRVGHALAQWRTPVGVDDSARVAYHFGRGLSADRRLASAYAHLAGDHAFLLGGYEDAVTHYAHAVDLGSHLDISSQRCRLLIGYSRALRSIRHPEARTTALSALTMARRLGDRELQVDAVTSSERHGMMFVQQYTPDEERVQIIDSICTLLVRTGHERTADYALLLTQLVTEHAWSEDHHYRAELLTRAADIARELGDGQLLARTNVAALIGLRTPHHRMLTTGALADLNSAVDAREEILQDVSITVWLSRARLEHGDLTGARAALESITPAQIDGDPELGWLAEYGRLGTDLAAGRLAECETRLTAIRAIPPSPTDHGYYGRLLPAVTALGTVRGDLREIVAQSEMMHANFDSNSALRPALAVALTDAGDHDRALNLLAWYTPERLAAIPVDPMWLSTFALIGRAAANVAAAGLCRQIYEYLGPHAECTVLTWASLYGVVHHHLAHLAYGFDDLARARYHVRDAVETHSTRGYVAWEIESGYLALCIEARASGALAATEVAELRARADDIGATATVRRIDELASH